MNHETASPVFDTQTRRIPVARAGTHLSRKTCGVVQVAIQAQNTARRSKIAAPSAVQMGSSEVSIVYPPAAQEVQSEQRPRHNLNQQAGTLPVHCQVGHQSARAGYAKHDTAAVAPAGTLPAPAQGHTIPEAERCIRAES